MRGFCICNHFDLYIHTWEPLWWAAPRLGNVRPQVFKILPLFNQRAVRSIGYYRRLLFSVSGWLNKNGHRKKN
jgi:hypothetical protein